MHEYAQMANVEMHVCGACGIRDIFDPYKKTVVLSDVNDDHWLKAGKDAYARLKQSVVFDLLKPNDGGGYDVVSIERALLHSLVELDGYAYHIIPEAVMDGPDGKKEVKLCKRCSRGWKDDIVAKRCDPLQHDASSDYEDLYSSNAPAHSIARGADFGSLSGLRNKGIRVDVSTLERLVLAEARCHQIVYKVVAYGEQTERKRLHGHSIVCPQKPVSHTHSGFGVAALEAAYAAVRIVFVGPTGMRGKLESAALKIDDMRLRPDIIYNFLIINHALHNGPCPPPFDEVNRLIATHSVAAHVKTYARACLDTEIEKRSAPSDIANVRSHAQSNKDNEDPLGDIDGDALPPHMVPIGLFESNPQPMEAVIQGISRVFLEGEGGNGDDNPIPDIAASGGNEGEGGNGDDNPIQGIAASIPGIAASGANGDTIYLQRDIDICSDYGGAADVIYKTWWPLMPLRRGFTRGASIPDAKMRQVFLYFDNRFATDLSFLFHAANMMMRHAVNRAVTARVKTSPEAFAEYKRLLHDGNFLQMIQDSRDDPQGKVARDVVQKVLGFINLSASKIPWGSRERASELGKLIADCRHFGPSSVFYSYAPDDVHNATTIRWATPYTGANSFPALSPLSFLQALRGTTTAERMAFAPDGLHPVPMDETSLQLLAAKNPVACAITFDHLVQNVRKNLIGLCSDRLKDTPVDERPIGICLVLSCLVLSCLVVLSCLTVALSHRLHTARLVILSIS